ncbi:MAG: KTSC domain-containing protein [Treponema sp.]|nr:KTSC domain-containing protein [Treponema sp.]
MEKEYVTSSNLRSIGYDKNTSILEIEFNSGATWQYFDFPETKWHEFKLTDSFGRYFNREIRGSYRESRVG